jgi:hypothetical protein
MNMTNNLMRLLESSGDLFSASSRYNPLKHARFHCSRTGLGGSQATSRVLTKKICVQIEADESNLWHHNFSWWRENYISGIYGVLQMPMKMHPSFDSAIAEVPNIVIENF